MELLEFGGRYLEAMRNYLVGAASRPDNVFVHVRVTNDQRGLAHRVVCFPYRVSKKDFGHYRFVLPGLAFDLFIGKQVPSECQRYSINNDTSPCVIAGSFDDWIVRTIPGR